VADRAEKQRKLQARIAKKRAGKAQATAMPGGETPAGATPVARYAVSGDLEEGKGEPSLL
jgi:hypothetical protein